MDLLHNSGSNQKVGGSYGAGSITAGPAASPRLASDYVSVAKTTAAAAPAPQPAEPAGAGPAPAAGPTVLADSGSVKDDKDHDPEKNGSSVTPEPKPAPEVPIVPPKRGGNGRWIILAAIIVLLLGGGAWWYFTQRNSDQSAQSPESPIPKEIEVGTLKDPRLVASSGEISLGGAAKDHDLSFHATLATSANTGAVVPEIEVRPMGQAFTGEATTKGAAVKAGGHDLDVSVTQAGIVDGSYHWQIRVTKGDKAGDWLTVGDDKAAAFSVDSLAPSAPTVGKVGDNKVSGSTASISGANRPVFSGKAEAGSKVAIMVSPENIKLTATVDATGAWSATPDQDIPNGQHNLSIVATDAAGNASPTLALTLTMNPAAAVSSTPTPSTSTDSTAKKLAPTGDWPHSVLALCMMLVATIGFILTRRQGALR